MTDFKTLQRPASPNTFLVCDEEYCPTAKSDMAAPVFDHAPEKVIAAWRRVLTGESKLTPVSADDAGMQYEYVQRSRLMNFPDTITVKFVPLAGGKQTKVLVYSRSKVGYSDMGVNGKRLCRWLRALEASLKAQS